MRAVKVINSLAPALLPISICCINIINIITHVTVFGAEPVRSPLALCLGFTAFIGQPGFKGHKEYTTVH